MLEELTIVIPAYRAERLIARTIESIINEGVLTKNIIVVEDGVFDDTKRVLDKYNVKHMIQNKNLGAPVARNKGLAEVKTKYVMFIDSDDFVSCGLISGLIEIANNASADVAFGPWRFDGENIKTGVLRYPPILSNDNWIFFWLNRGIIPTCSVLWRVDSILSISGWDERIKKNQDGEIAIRAFLNNFVIGVSNQGYSTYWQHESEHRVSDARISDRNFTSNMIYESIKNKFLLINDSYYSSEIGKYCCKEAWMCFSNNCTQDGQVWLTRAHIHGYTNKGYSFTTKILGGAFGYKYGAKIKSFLFPFLKKFVYK